MARALRSSRVGGKQQRKAASTSASPSHSFRPSALPPEKRRETSAASGISASVRTFVAGVSEKAMNQPDDASAPRNPAPRLARHSRSDPTKASRSRSASHRPSSALDRQRQGQHGQAAQHRAAFGHRLYRGAKGDCRQAEQPAAQHARADQPPLAKQQPRLARIDDSTTPAVTTPIASQDSGDSTSPISATPSKATITGSVLI